MTHTLLAMLHDVRFRSVSNQVARVIVFLIERLRYGDPSIKLVSCHAVRMCVE